MKNFTLRDVLAQESLGLRLVTREDPAALDRVVIGVHGTEVPQPVSWLQRDWVLLITGVRLVDSPERQRALVGELAEGRLAALGFGVGIDFDGVPEAIVEEAERHRFPVFEIPLATPFREIIAFVNRSLLSDDLHVMRRLTSMREFLVDALRDDDPRAEIVERLGSLLDSDPVVFTHGGDVELGGGDVDVAALWRAVGVQRGEQEDDRLDGEALADRDVIAVPIVDRDEPASWLAVAVSPGRSPEAYARPLVETTALLLGGLAGVRRVARSLERATRAAFVRDLLDREEDFDSAAAHRAAAVGIDLATAARGVVLAPADRRPETLERALTQAELALQAAGLPAALGERDGRIVGVVQAGADQDPLRVALERLAARLSRLSVGIGRPVGSVAQLRSSLRDAQVALRPARPRAQRARPGLHWFEDFDLVSWLIVSADRDALGQKAVAALGDLVEEETLMETLECFLDHRLSVTRSAKSLNLHPNSLRYRLARIEERLGRQLDDPDALATLQIARRALGR